LNTEKVTGTSPANPTADIYQVIAVRMGTRATLRSDVYLNYHLYGERDGPAVVDYYFWVIRNQRHTVIVDTGFSAAAGGKRNRDLIIHPRAALEELDIDPAKVQHVILTHGHYDHIGNADIFTAATLHMAESEYRFWTSPTSAHTQFSYFSEPQELDHLRIGLESGRLRLFSGRTEPVPGVEIVEVGGHTPGQAMVYAPTTDGLVLLASDAVHFYEELERDMPFTAVSDLPAMYRAFNHIREESRTRKIIVVPGHDPDVLHRFEPFKGGLYGNAITIGQHQMPPKEK
jgi:glyoxylase-like metal-dependent hydrolase (beta-lactamase superfamily II)